MSQVSGRIIMSSASSRSSKRRLDFGAVVDDSDIRNTELQMLLHYAIVPEIFGDDNVKSNNLNNETARPSVWIEAEAGVGKSILLQQFRSKITCSFSHRAITIQGKFEPRAAASEPFAALREAIQDFVQSFLTLPENDFFRQEWSKGLQEEMNIYGAFDLLLGILPELRPCFETGSLGGDEGTDIQKDDDDQNPFGNFNSREYRFERFRVAFRNLIRFTCRQLWRAEQKQSLVLILDDFHWVDPDSLQIVKTLMEDPRKPHNFRFIAATRPLGEYPNVLDLYTTLTVPTKPVSHSQLTLKSLAASRQKLRASKSESKGKLSISTQYTQAEHPRHSEASQSDQSEATKYRRIPNLEMMELSRLSTRQIASVLNKLLSLDSSDDNEYWSRLLELARIIKDKTQGNTFVVIQFLRLIEKRNLFVYSEEHRRWEFKILSISQLDYHSENVSKVVAESLDSGSKRRKSALMVAASFGVSQFDVPTIVHASKVVQADMDMSDSSDEERYGDPIMVKQRVDEMKEQLAEALKDGFVEEIGSGKFRFAHDRIRESAYSLLPEGSSRKLVHLKVGRQLRAWMDTQEECKFRLVQCIFLFHPHFFSHDVPKSNHLFSWFVPELPFQGISTSTCNKPA
jgi:predicted ATPase